MVQHSLIIENDSGKAVREDINDAFQAVVTNYAGLEEPDVTYPNMFWYDTQNHVLKIRNEVNTEWIIVTGVDQDDLNSTANVGPGRHSYASLPLAGPNHSDRPVAAMHI